MWLLNNCTVDDWLQTNLSTEMQHWIGLYCIESQRCILTFHALVTAPPTATPTAHTPPRIQWKSIFGRIMESNIHLKFTCILWFENWESPIHVNSSQTHLWHIEVAVPADPTFLGIFRVFDLHLEKQFQMFSELCNVQCSVNSPVHNATLCQSWPSLNISHLKMTKCWSNPVRVKMTRRKGGNYSNRIFGKLGKIRSRGACRRYWLIAR